MDDLSNWHDTYRLILKYRTNRMQWFEIVLEGR